MKSYIKNFGQFQKVNEGRADNLEDLAIRIYESTMQKIMSEKLNEDIEDLDWADEDDELSSGEKAALTRGLQRMTKPQMAAIYLLAKGRSDENVDNHEYIKMIPGINSFGYVDETDRDFRITIPGMADAIGMDSDRTLTYTRDKFQNLISGIGETASQSLSPKLIKAHDALSSMSVSNIAAIASDAIQDSSYTVNRDAADSRKEIESEKSKIRRDKLKERNKKLAEELHRLVLDMKAESIPMGLYSRIIFNKKKEEYPGLSKTAMYDIYVKWLKDNRMNPILYIKKPMVA